jgi:hypothetical protein
VSRQLGRVTIECHESLTKPSDPLAQAELSFDTWLPKSGQERNSKDFPQRNKTQFSPRDSFVISERFLRSFSLGCEPDWRNTLQAGLFSPNRWARFFWEISRMFVAMCYCTWLGCRRGGSEDLPLLRTIERCGEDREELFDEDPLGSHWSRSGGIRWRRRRVRG